VELIRLAYDRLFRKLTKENLWLYILKLLTERSMYAYEIAKMIEIQFGFSIAKITVYVVLYKMFNEGLIIINKETSDDVRSDRRYYIITEKGEKTLEDGRALIKNFLAKIL
jgi:PadR family transcriptional regulator PadR